MLARRFGFSRRFVDFGWVYKIGLDADLAQQIEPPRRGGGKDELCGHGSGPTLRQTARNTDRLFEAESNPTLGQIVGRHLDIDLVACQHTDAILPHFAGRVRQYLMVVIKFDAKHRVWQQFSDCSAEFD